MEEALKAVLIQTLGYAVAMFAGLIGIGFLQRGFFFPWFKVRASLGKKILIRVRQVSHWEYFVGSWNEQDIIFGDKKNRKRVNNVTREHIYRSLGINWVDFDGKTWSILPTASTEAVTGFDPEKQESLVTRALYKPPLDDVKDKIVILLLILAIVGAGASAYFGYVNAQKIEAVRLAVESLSNGLVVPTG